MADGALIHSVEVSDEESMSIMEKGGDDKSMKSFKSKGSIKSEV